MFLELRGGLLSVSLKNVTCGDYKSGGYSPAALPRFTLVTLVSFSQIFLSKGGPVLCIYTSVNGGVGSTGLCPPFDNLHSYYSQARI